MSSSVVNDNKRTDRLSRKLRVELPRYEVYMYLATVWVCLIYASYNVLLASNKFFKMLPRSNMKLGWSSYNWPLDTTDKQWANLFPFLVKLTATALLPHLFLSQLIKKAFKPCANLISLFYITFSFIYISYSFGGRFLLWLMTQPIIMFGVVFIFRSKLLVWICSSSVIIFFESEIITTFYFWCFRDYEINQNIFRHISIISFFWMNLRGISFSLDLINQKLTRVELLRMCPLVFAYCFYLPNCLIGPMYNFSSFIEALGDDRNKQDWNFRQIFDFCLRLLRVLFWGYFYNFLLHFFRHSALIGEPYILSKLDMWTLHGLCACVSIGFFLKHYFFFGLPGVLAHADGFKNFPPPPICVTRICYSTLMWRRFDVGLYEFITRYIYRPIVDSIELHNNWITRSFASLLSLSFILVWQGFVRKVFLWTLFKFICLTIETLGSELCRNQLYLFLEKRFLTPRGTRRLRAAISVPLFALATISHLIFLGNENIAYMITTRCIFSYAAWPIALPALLILLYSTIQYSIEVDNTEIRAQLEHIKQKND